MSIGMDGFDAYEKKQRKSIMKNRKQSLEETYINKALHYKKELKNCKWWEFKKKKDLKIAINTSIEFAMMYSNVFENR